MTLLQFPPSLTGRQRAALHEAAEAAGLLHSSSGNGAERHIRIGDAGGSVVQVASSRGTKQPLTDVELCAALSEHLHIDASAAFVGSQQSKSASKKFAGSAGQRGGQKSFGVVTLDDFLARTAPLLELERAAELAQAEDTLTRYSPEKAQAKGQVLLNLKCSDVSGGLLGRTLLTLVSNKGAASGKELQPLPQHKFSPHDIVNIRSNKADASGPPVASGVVYRLHETSIIIAVDDAPEDGLQQPLRLEKLANTVTYDRLQTTLRMLGSSSSQQQPQPGAALADVIFSARQPRFQSQPPAWTSVNTGLDESQRQAVSLALSAQDIALIHGPPGTGKTTAVVEAVVQEVRRGNRVLACAASNIAVDNLAERLARQAPKTKVLRLGHPARLLPEVLKSSLEAHILKSDNSALAKDCRKEMKSITSKMAKLGRKDYAERRSLRAELRQLQKEERKRQERAVVEVIRNAQVVCCTLTGALGRDLEGKNGVFDVVYVDEAAQALELATWGALLKAPRAVLAGDHLQLPPTIISEEAAAKGLRSTLFERLQEMHGSKISAMLTVQYRMNKDVMQWSSEEFYAGALTAHESVAQHTLNTMRAEAAADELPVLLLVDTAGCDMEEVAEEEGASISNPGEAQAVLAHAAALMKAGISAADIGIITPYNAQVTLLRELRPRPQMEKLEISSVDGFQGREKEAIIISMVRSNDKGTVGFLTDSRRMNVAVTRARRHCAIFCDTETVGKDPFLQRLIAYFEANGTYASVAELDLEE